MALVYLSFDIDLPPFTPPRPYSPLHPSHTPLLSYPPAKAYLFHLVLNAKRDYWKTVANSTRKDPNITKQDILRFKLPFPTMQVQLEIIENISQEQKLVNGNKELIKIFEQKIKDEINKLWQPGKKEEVYEVEEGEVSMVAEE